MSQTKQPGRGEWKHELFEGSPDCCYACFCRQCYALRLAKVAGKEGCDACTYCVCPIRIICLRADIKKQHGIEGGCCHDCICLYCCYPFVAVQTMRQIE